MERQCMEEKATWGLGGTKRETLENTKKNQRKF